MSWIGVTFNSKEMTMKIDQLKIEETLIACKDMVTKTFVSKKDVQRIIGRLNHATKLSENAKIFLNRLLDLLCSVHNKKIVSLPDEAKDDLSWFIKYLSHFNGTIKKAS